MGLPELSSASNLSPEKAGSERQPASPGHLSFPAVFSESCSLKGLKNKVFSVKEESLHGAFFPSCCKCDGICQEFTGFAPGL